MRPLPPLSDLNTASASRAAPFGSHLALVALVALVAVVSLLSVQHAGLQGLMAVTGLLVLGVAFTAVSFSYLIAPVLAWLVFLLGFRNMLMLVTPGLPDIAPDRVLLVWIFSLFLLKVAMGERTRARWHLLDTLLLAHLLYLLGSIMYHDNTGFNSWTRSYLMGYAAYFAAKYVIDGRLNLIRLVFGLFLVLNIYYGVVAVAEHFKFSPLIWPKAVLDPTIYRQWPGRSHGVFLQPAVYGIVMGMLLPIQIYHLRIARNVLVKLLLYASIPVVVIGLYFTYTRGSWLAGIFGLLAMAAVGWRRYLPLVGRILIVGALLLAAGVISFKQDALFMERLGTERTITGRLGTLGRAYRIFLDHPVFGCGYFRFNEVKYDYADTIEVPFFGVVRRGHDIHSTIHDMYLGTLAEEGLVGAALQLMIYLQIFFIFRRRYLLRHRGDPFARDMMPVLAGLMIGYLVGAFAIDYRFFGAMITLFYFSAGLVAGYPPPEQAALRQEPHRPMLMVENPRPPVTG